MRTDQVDVVGKYEHAAAQMPKEYRGTSSEITPRFDLAKSDHVAAHRQWNFKFCAEPIDCQRACLILR